MIAQFKTADDSIFMADTETLQWAHITLGANDPESKVVSEGVLTSRNFGRFQLTPRTEKTEGPGAGLCNIALMPIVQGRQVILCLSANVPVKDFTMPVPVNEVIYEIISEKAVPVVHNVDDSQESRAGEAVAELEELPPFEAPAKIQMAELQNETEKVLRSEYPVDAEGLDPEIL